MHWICDMMYAVNRQKKSSWTWKSQQVLGIWKYVHDLAREVSGNSLKLVETHLLGYGERR